MMPAKWWVEHDFPEQPDTFELGEMFQPHAEHVARMLSAGFISGEICDENFSGWWDIVTD